ncbi:small GTP-binding protein, putative [Trichomonas vaginalis G3]|uniref:Small GTP-binding protein, putative n=2 Tax=Trichomonas vaginalis TaxID=5722 RepID=A0A8U0WPP7_TRIV3|nr:small Rab GTPase RabB1 [Trichomonas vaginalis G3]AAX97463.1 small Rab GTPase RabB1 [Trichomonas vaginalis]EAX91725.1 small GTP-binding protein, putative [Trichomonas vaginalis G3]KAI5524630.1 small Rab GTPase RabB1 [Trichomonas vaginalis G3]|eukprot:XP_001304655.1 small GTP-binding protein [Trichomonas vaginalis G3]
MYKNSQHAYAMKVILVGSSGVGKTSLVSAFFENPFDLQALPTVAPASCNATINLPGGTRVELQIWDTAGQERFQAISQMFYRDSHIAFVCYDTTTEDTVPSWVERVRSEVPDCIIFLVSTKSDTLTPEQLLKVREKGQKFVDEQEAYMHCITSANKKNGVQELFTEAAKCCTMVYQSNQPTVDLTPTGGDNKKTGCC